jgi:hypothetical protein
MKQGFKNRVQRRRGGRPKAPRNGLGHRWEGCNWELLCVEFDPADGRPQGVPITVLRPHCFRTGNVSEFLRMR